MEGHDIEEVVKQVDVLTTTYESLSDRVFDLEEWRKPAVSGARGSEERLQLVENRVYEYDCERIIPSVRELRADVEAVKLIADNAIKVGVNTAVNDTLDARERKSAYKLKLWSPIIIAVLALIGTILSVILR